MFTLKVTRSAQRFILVKLSFLRCWFQSQKLTCSSCSLCVLCELCRTLRLFLQHIFLGVPSRCCECLWSSLHSLGLNSWGRDLHSFNSLTWASGLSLRVLMEEFVACFWACFGFPVKLCDLTQQELCSALRLRSASLQTDSIMNLSAIFTGSRRSCWIKVPAGRGSPLEFAGSLLF